MDTYTTCVILLLAHLLGDFVFPWGHEREGAPAAGRSTTRQLAVHGLTHFLLAVAALAVLTGGAAPFPTILGPIALLTAAHLAIDLGSIWAERRDRSPGPLGTLLFDQAAHLVVLTVIGSWMAAGSPRSLVSSLTSWLQRQGPEIATVSVVFVAVVFGGGRLLALLLEPFAAQLRVRTHDGPSAADTADQLTRAGRWIGWLERTLILTAVTLGSPAAAGLIVAAKSVFRFSETKDRPFAEYFLIGTLLSVVLAVAGGIALRLFLF